MFGGVARVGRIMTLGWRFRTGSIRLFIHRRCKSGLDMMVRVEMWGSDARLGQ